MVFLGLYAIIITLGNTKRKLGVNEMPKPKRQILPTLERLKGGCYRAEIDIMALIYTIIYMLILSTLGLKLLKEKQYIYLGLLFTPIIYSQLPATEKYQTWIAEKCESKEGNY